MKLSSRARYALRFMIDLAQYGNDGGFVRLQDIADRQGISREYLVQLAMGLKNAGLIRSASGVHGGYALSRPPDQVNVLDIVEAAIGPVNIVGCVSNPDICDRADVCRARKIWQAANNGLTDSFRGVTLAEINAAPNGVV